MGAPRTIAMRQHVFRRATDATDFCAEVIPPRTATDLQRTGRRGFSMFDALPRTQRTFARSNVMRAHAHARTCLAIRQKSVAPVAQHVFCWIRCVESVASPWRFQQRQAPLEVNHVP